MADKTQRVLVVDDEPMVVSSLELLLEERWTVATAGSGAEARALLERDEIAVVIADARMPGETGVELFAWARARVPDAVRILLTGYADMDMVVQGINEGKVWHYVRKPWDNQDLVALVERAIEYREVRQRLERSERRYKAMFRGSLVGMAEVSIDGDILEANRSFADIVGAAMPDELAGREARSLFADGAQYERLLAELRSTTEVQRRDATLTRTDGRVSYVLLNAAVRSGNGGASTVDTSILDLTERRSLVEDRRSLQRDLLLHRFSGAEHAAEIESLLDEALRLILEMSGARRGTIGLRPLPDLPRRISVGMTEAESSAVSARAAPPSGEHVRIRLGTAGDHLDLLDPEVEGSLDASVEARIRSLIDPISGLIARLEVRNPSASPALERFRSAGLIGSGAALAAVLRQLEALAKLDVGLLLTGESGTGKSLLARLVHESSARATAPFVPVNCATLPESLVESELFGAVPGAHSAALRKVDGKVLAAQGGTLFLDEVGELPLGSQAKLLQLLQSREYFPLGSARVMRADIRIIAATNVDLREAVAARRFREDLYYRLHVMPVRVPSLSERVDDIPELIHWFCTRAYKRHNLPPVRLSLAAVESARTARWPGNVRQLEYAIESAVIRATTEGTTILQPHHIFPESAPVLSSQAQTFHEAIKQLQQRLLESALTQAGGNVNVAAVQLSLTRSHVYALLRTFGINPRAFAGSGDAVA